MIEIELKPRGEYMLKKGLIGLIIIALAGGSYWYYDDYQKKEKVRLIKERDEEIVRMIEKKMADNIQKAKERKERELQEAEEEKARQKRIAEGNPIIEEIITYYPDSDQKKEQYTLVEGKKEGVEIQWRENGQKKLEANYKNGKLHGKYWDDILYITEGYYEDGKEHGIFQKWSVFKDRERKGQPKKLFEKVFFQSGNIEGEAFVYDPNKNYKYLFENDVIKRVDATFLTGEKALEILPHPTKSHHWSVTEWYKNGQVSHEGFLVLASFRKIDNKTDNNIFYRKNGTKFLELEISHDSNNGLCRRWDENGKLITELFSRHYGIDKSKPHFGRDEDCMLTNEERKIIALGE